MNMAVKMPSSDDPSDFDEKKMYTKRTKRTKKIYKGKGFERTHIACYKSVKVVVVSIQVRCESRLPNV